MIKIKKSNLLLRLHLLQPGALEWEQLVCHSTRGSTGATTPEERPLQGLGELNELNIPERKQEILQDFNDLQLPASDVQMSSLTTKFWTFASSYLQHL